MTLAIQLQDEIDQSARTVEDTTDRLRWLDECVAAQFPDISREVIVAELLQIQQNMQHMHNLIHALEAMLKETMSQRDGAMFDADYYRSRAMHVVASAVGEGMKIGHQDAVRLLEAMSGISGTYISQYTMNDFTNAARQLSRELLEEEIFLDGEGDTDDDYE